MISCYTPEQPSSYSLADVTESLPLSPSVSLRLTLDSCSDKPSRKLRQERSRSRSLLYDLRDFCLFFKKKKNPFASRSSLLQARPPPPIPDEQRFSVFIAYSDYTSLRLPYLFISMEPTPNYTHQRWRLGEEEEEEEEEEGGAGFGCSFKRHSASCC